MLYQYPTPPQPLYPEKGPSLTGVPVIIPEKISSQKLPNRSGNLGVQMVVGLTYFQELNHDSCTSITTELRDACRRAGRKGRNGCMCVTHTCMRTCMDVCMYVPVHLCLCV